MLPSASALAADATPQTRPCHVHMHVQVLLPKLEHFAVESSNDVEIRLLAVDGLPCMLSERSAPALKSVALKGVSQEPFSSERASQPRRYSSFSA